MPVFYDPTDGMIYEVEGVDDELREWSLHQALAAALLDQHLRWSSTIADPETPRTEAIGLRMMIAADARSIADESVDFTIDGMEFQEQFDELAAAAGDEALRSPAYATALLGAGDSGAWVRFGLVDDVTTRDDLLEVRSDAAVLDAARDLRSRPDELGDVASESRGMLYWYHVLAGRLPAAEAWDAALGWEGDKVEIDAEAPNALCVSAQISAVDEAGRVRLFDALTRWAAAGPDDAAATVTAVGTERITVRSCDPGNGADTLVNAAPPLHGEAGTEHVAVSLTGAVTDEQRRCVIAAVRGFDVAGILAAEGQARFYAVLEEIGNACENPA